MPTQEEFKACQLDCFIFFLPRDIVSGDFYIKGDKMPIGGEQRELERIFTLHTIDLLPDSPTHFYMFSDGFQDQFGGQEDKKFGVAQMRNMLLTIHTQDLASQHEHLANTFAQWLGRGKQIDDVLVLGLCV